MELTYDLIKDLIVSQEIEGQMIKLKIKAANQETPLETVAVVMPDADEIKAKVMKQTAKTVAVGVGTSAAASALGGLIGGTAGSLVSSGGSMASSAAASSMMNTSDLMNSEMSDEKVQAAIVQAFSHLQTYYKYENGSWEYVTPTY